MKKDEILSSSFFCNVIQIRKRFFRHNAFLSAKISFSFLKAFLNTKIFFGIKNTLPIPVQVQKYVLGFQFQNILLILTNEMSTLLKATVTLWCV